MVYYCNYDNTAGGTPIPQFMRCYPENNDDAQRNGRQVLSIPDDQGIISEFKKATSEEDEDLEDTDEIEDVPDDEMSGEERVAIDNEEGVESTVSVKKPERTNPCFTRKSFLVISVLMSCIVTFLIIVVILRSLRVQPGVGAESLTVSQPFVPADPNTGNSRPLDGLLLEGAICEEHDECDSGLCGGNMAPYSCQPKVGSCQVCHQDRNCLSGSCLLRNGQSVCASTADGLMDDGCFCDLDEQCNSRRCEGVFPDRICKEISMTCTANEDCTSEVCHDGQCRDSDYVSLESNQPTGERCSEDSDCPSRICVMDMASLGTEGECSSGETGSICNTNEDCESDRCSQGLCREKQLPGRPCKGNTECDSSICLGFSDFNSGLCLDTSPENACVTEGGTCGSSGKCVVGFCKDFNLTQGSICTEDSDCQSAACVWSPLRVERICG